VLLFGCSEMHDSNSVACHAKSSSPGYLLACELSVHMRVAAIRLKKKRSRTELPQLLMSCCLVRFF
jgi:hypothetical protein